MQPGEPFTGSTRLHHYEADQLASLLQKRLVGQIAGIQVSLARQLLWSVHRKKCRSCVQRLDAALRQELGHSTPSADVYLAHLSNLPWDLGLVQQGKHLVESLGGGIMG